MYVLRNTSFEYHFLITLIIIFSVSPESLQQSLNQNYENQDWKDKLEVEFEMT